MKLEKALKQIGATIVKVEKSETRVVLFLRIDQSRAGLWTQTVNDFLLSSSRVNAWNTDVSKYFFVDGGVVKFLWRVVLGGDPYLAAAALSAATQEIGSVTSGEVTAQPLVGRKTYPFDPSSGLIKGAQDSKAATQIISTMRS